MSSVPVAPSTVRSLAARLIEAESSGVPTDPVRNALPDGDVDAAYAVQQAVADHWVGQGRRIVGRKIGLTSRSVQQQLGVDQPDFGMLYADAIVGSGEEIATGRLILPRIEAEIAFVLGRDLDHADTTVADVIRATDFVLPAMEVVDSRILNWDITILDTVADNASAGVMVLGGPPRRLRDLDLAGTGMAMTRNSRVLSTGIGAACLGNPVNAVAWLARRMAALGKPLKAGDLVMSGALGPLAPVAAGDCIDAFFSGIGTVRAVFTP